MIALVISIIGAGLILSVLCLVPPLTRIAEALEYANNTDDEDAPV